MRRLDTILFEMQLAPSKAKAQELIRTGGVEVRGRSGWSIVIQPGKKFEDLLIEDVRIRDEHLLRFVSRAGHKLDRALERLRINVNGWKVLDVGISTGGFTDCLLQNGARHIVGVDVGHSQLAEKLVSDPRVTLHEGINARSLSSEPTMQIYQNYFELVVMDVSFISIQKILSQLTGFIVKEGALLSLVKPQFELGSSALNKRGIVKDRRLYDDLKTKICNDLQQHGLKVLDYFSSELPGQDGNQEFFVYAKLQ